ncbi:MAG TPA: tautomerase family protein [Methanosarcina sp.]|nr:tautomerase family protein [Methanosarcina sp.]
MPFVEIKFIEGEIPEEDIEKLIESVTDILVSLIGENIRGVTHVAVQEIKSGYWGAGGKAVGLDDIKALLAGSTEKTE